MRDHSHKQGDQSRFRIWVAGRLGEGFADGFDGIEQQDVDGVTTLTGNLIDQSHIFGVLDRLRHLGVEVRRFETYRPGDPGYLRSTTELRRNHDQDPTHAERPVK